MIRSEIMPTSSTYQPPFVIRSATPADLPSITALLSASSLPTSGIDRALGGFHVAHAAGEIVGVIGVESCDGKRALLRSTAVSPQWRHRGVGRALVEHAIRVAEANGVDALYLLTTTAESYFPSFGFKIVNRSDVPAAVAATEEYRSACPTSATVMARATAGLYAERGTTARASSSAPRPSSACIADSAP
jgi:amino-acid N-acetyltransferase